MKRRTLALFILLAAVFTILVAGYAEDQDKDTNKEKLIPYKLLTTIDIPGGLTGFDISWVDSESGRYYLANRGNATATPPVSPSISVIDTRHNKFLYAIPMSTGGNGVAAIRRIGDDDDDDDGRGTLVVGGTDSTAYNNAGLAGIGFGQDPIEYNTHTHHTNLDTYERVIEDDVKASAIAIAATLYQLAMRDEMLPRLPSAQMPPPPKPATAGGLR